MYFVTNSEQVVAFMTSLAGMKIFLSDPYISPLGFETIEKTYPQRIALPTGISYGEGGRLGAWCLSEGVCLLEA